MKNYLRLMRIKHYIKNLLIFLPILFSGNAFDIEIAGRSIMGFIAFSFSASLIYIVNDVHDLEYDKCHPTKKNRPLASGAVRVECAWVLAALLSAGVIFLNVAVLAKPAASVLLIIYILINLAYSFGLKCYLLIDIFIIVAGYMLRVAFGGAIVSIGISSWMYLTVMAMSFYLAFGKRRNEMHRDGLSCREVLKRYSEQFLDKMMYVSLGLTVVFYSMWCVTPNDFIKGDRLIWTVPLVLLICMKYSMDVEGDSNGDPAEVLLGDKVLILLVILYGALMMALFYGVRIAGIIGI